MWRNKKRPCTPQNSIYLPSLDFATSTNNIRLIVYKEASRTVMGELRPAERFLKKIHCKNSN
jgi:hypothetical protein